ncbi:MAG: hypothetical protein KGQ54_01405 [Verrucomicrobia bacterium]|nr:hypothetical protein [Verrucomicrobiota bacterium]NDE63761.1 hypothetical protein [Chlamydiota bacterium]
MFSRAFLGFLFLSTISCLNSAEVKSPEQIQSELDQAEKDFEIAQKMFIPWYTGPLITGSAKNAPKGKINIQPYLTLKTAYGEYDNNRHYTSTPSLFSVNPLLAFQVGITNWLDFSIQPQATFKSFQGDNGGSFNDLNVVFGFQLYKETLYLPSVRLLYTEIFPTGNYSRLYSPLDAGGAGVFQSVVGLNLGKVLWWFPEHPMALRLATNVQFPTDSARVYGLNSYGGGASTNGTVRVRPTFNIDFGYEYSITQKWVFAIDLVYTLSGRTTFTGMTGLDQSGKPYVLGGPSSDNFSMSPAIEYNVSDTGGFIGGVWFSVTGRNSSSYVAGLISYTQLF